MQLHNEKSVHLCWEQGSASGQSNSTATNACLLILYISSHSLWSGIQFIAAVDAQRSHCFLHCKHTYNTHDSESSLWYMLVLVQYLSNNPLYLLKHQAGHANSREHKSESNRKSLALSQGHLQPVPDARPKTGSCPAFPCLLRKSEPETGVLNG